MFDFFGNKKLKQENQKLQDEIIFLESENRELIEKERFALTRRLDTESLMCRCEIPHRDKDRVDEAYIKAVMCNDLAKKLIDSIATIEVEHDLKDNKHIYTCCIDVVKPLEGG